MVIPRVEKPVISIIWSSARGPNSVVQNHDQRDFSGNMENTLLMTASSRTDLSINQDGNDEIRNGENFEDGDFPALRLNHD